MRPLQLLSGLTSLNMSKNLLTDVEMDIKGLLLLRTLDLSDNQIPSLISPVRNMTALESLNLANNPLMLLPQGPSILCFALHGLMARCSASCSWFHAALALSLSL